MCDCLKKKEAALTAKMLELNGGEAIDPVTIVNKALDTNIGEYRLFSHITGRFRKNGRTQKFDDRLIYTYCPICGEKYPTND